MNSTVKNLQKEIGLFLVAFVVSSTIIIISVMYKESATVDKQMATDGLEQAKEQYHLAIDRKQILKEFENKYKKLEKTGVVGDEYRLSWIDTIEQTVKKSKIPYVNYKISKQIKKANNDLSGSYPGIDVFQSEMVLDMQLLHEGDLYTVLNQLDKKAKGLFDINSCTMSSLQSARGSILESKTDKNFTARCNIDWYTMKPLSAPSLVESGMDSE
jgi:hypothetical protein